MSQKRYLSILDFCQKREILILSERVLLSNIFASLEEEKVHNKKKKTVLPFFFCRIKLFKYSVCVHVCARVSVYINRMWIT